MQSDSLNDRSSGHLGWAKRQVSEAAPRLSPLLVIRVPTNAAVPERTRRRVNLAAARAAIVSIAILGPCRAQVPADEFRG